MDILELAKQLQPSRSAKHLPPSNVAAGRVIDRIVALLYPEDGSDAEISREVIDDIRTQMTGLIARSMGSSHGVRTTAAPALADAFLHQLPEMREIGYEDAAAAMRGDPAAESLEQILQNYPGFAATIRFRIAHALHELFVPLLPRVITEYAHNNTGIDIHPGAKIGRGFFIDHGTGVVIGETAEIGKNVRMYQGVTLGALSFKSDEDGKVIREEKRHPTLEDNVIIYAGATVLGGRTFIGHDSVIGGNVWLTKSVPPHSLVTMPPPSFTMKSLIQNGEKH